MGKDDGTDCLDFPIFCEKCGLAIKSCNQLYLLYQNKFKNELLPYSVLLEDDIKSYIKLNIQTHGEAFYSITDQVIDALNTLIQNYKAKNGLLHVFCLHTSSGLVVSESYDPTARQDMEAFLKHLAPRDLPFIRHTLEGSDDSPSHMKSLLVQPQISFIVDGSKLIMGSWQGIYLAEFRDQPKLRHVLIKYQPDL